MNLLLHFSLLYVKLDLVLGVKADTVRNLLRDGKYRPSEIADMAGCRREFVSRIKARESRPPSQYSLILADVQTLKAESRAQRSLLDKIALRLAIDT